MENQVLWWIIGILGTVVVALCAAWGMRIDSRVTKLEESIKEQAVSLAKIETRSESIIETLGLQNRMMDDIGHKIDRNYKARRSEDE